MFMASEKDTIVVSQSGKGNFSSIQEAINQTKSFPYERIIILIKNGTYKEKVKIHEWNTNITLVGENKEKTIIAFDDYFSKLNLGRNSTFYTPTLSVEANDTVLKNLTISNTAGEVGQAVALGINANRVAVVNCKILGNQDTLYATGEGKQFFKDCYVEGTTDFIFGSATAYFENCQIHSKKDSFITAASTPEKQPFGFVFNGCQLTADEGITKVYLGRPWRFYAKTAFIGCILGKHILPEGWNNWDKKEAEIHSFYAEYKNTGEGAHPPSRVQWSHQLSAKEILKFNKKNILQDSHNLNWYENF